MVCLTRRNASFFTWAAAVALTGTLKGLAAPPPPTLRLAPSINASANGGITHTDDSLPAKHLTEAVAESIAVVSDLAQMESFDRHNRVSADSALLLRSPPPSADFAGMFDDNTANPPGVAGAAGPDHVVEFLNAGRTIYDKTGAVTADTISLQAFWSALGTAAGEPAQAVRSPRVLWDHYAQRWVVSSLGGGTNRWVLIAVSQTEDPAGAYWLYAIKVNVNTNGFDHTGHQADYDMLGLDPNNVILTANIFNLSFTSFFHSDVYILNKARLMAGPDGQSLVHNSDFRIIHSPCPAFGANRSFAPCVTYDQTPSTAENYLIDNGWYDENDYGIRYVRVSRITGTGAAAVLDCMGNANFVTTTGCYNFELAEAQQPDGCNTIYVGDSRMIGPGVVRNGLIWFAHSGGAPADPCPDPGGEGAGTRAEVYWTQQDPAKIVSPGLPEQFGRIHDPEWVYFYPSISVGQDDCVMVGFSGSGPGAGQYASAFYASRQAGDPPGTMQPVALLKAGEDLYLKTQGTPRNRWGDYSSTCVDPVDDTTLWTLQPFARPQVGGGCPTDNTGRWGTWWGAMACSVPQCACPGDVNDDALVNGSDVQAFVECLIDGTTPGGDCGCADMDHVGGPDMGDVPDFVTALLSAACGT